MAKTDRTEPTLDIRLFGSFDVRVEGRPLRPLRTRKGQWLLALLALRHGREVDRVARCVVGYRERLHRWRS